MFPSWAFVYHLICFGLKRQVQRGQDTFEVKVGDCIIGFGGKLTEVKTKSRHWYNDGIEVLTLSTDNGAPFLVGNCVVRAENAKDNIGWVDTHKIPKLAA